MVEATSYSTSPGKLQIMSEAELAKWAHTGNAETAASVAAGLALIGFSYYKWSSLASGGGKATKAA